jgi:hypothetical protein
LQREDRMAKKWFLKLSVNIKRSHDYRGKPAEYGGEICFPLHSSYQRLAILQAELFAKRIKTEYAEKNWDYLRECCHDISPGDELSFENFRLVSEGGWRKVEKTLDIQI